MLKWILKKRLIKRMQLEYKKTDDIDYSDCGFPVAHLGRDLYYYEKVEKDFENGFYM